MSLKNGLYIISSLSLLVSLLTSCLGNNSNDEAWVTEDAELTYFGLSSDSVPDLINVVFSIDQSRSEIYNRDSMAYLTEIKDKVIINYLSGAGVNNVLNVTDGDSIWVNDGDSIDISKPLKLRVYAVNGKTTKEYTAKLNIHQIDPDSVQYSQVAAGQAFLKAEEIKTVLFKGDYSTFTKTAAEVKLYGSSDAGNWSPVALSGLPNNAVIRGIINNGDKLFAYTDDGYYYESVTVNNWKKTTLDYPVISILGYLKLGQGQPQLKEGLSLIVKKDNRNVFAFLSVENQLTLGNEVPANFPISDFASFSNERMKLGYVTIIAGTSAAGEILNDTWSTGNGLYWAKLTNTAFIFPPLQGANVIEYNNEFWVINGKGNDGTYNSGVYSSMDGGTTWTLRAEKCFFPENYPLRYGASAVVDASGTNFYILGGRNENDGVLPDIWRGVLNRQTFSVK